MVDEPDETSDSPPPLVRAQSRPTIGRRRLLGGALATISVGVLSHRLLARAGNPELVLDSGALATEHADRVDPPDPPSPGAYDADARFVAMYGFPGSSALGALGEQSLAGSVERVGALAAPYAAFGRPVIPTFEILASVASVSAGPDGDYSNEFAPSRFQPWIDAAAANRYHVVFDLQPGRARFPDQAQEYEALWRQPNVSIALDPEWRVGPDERPGGGRIGTVDADEVNETIDYIHDVVGRHHLPAKMLIVHQFTPSMITNKPMIRGTPRVQVVLHMDGFGSLTLKRASYARMLDGLPAGAVTGWKNFIDEDRPTPTPTQTMANTPAPVYVSYQ